MTTTEQQDKLWDELSDDSRQYIICRYNAFHEFGRYSNCQEDTNLYRELIREYNLLFGQHHLPIF